MPRCPACESFRIVVVISPERRAFCLKCGARWLQNGSIQRAVRPGRPSPSQISPVQPA